MGDSADRVDELRADFGDPRASAAWRLCDRHPSDTVAFTLVDADLNATRLAYGSLRASSETCAAALAELGVAREILGRGADEPNPLEQDPRAFLAGKPRPRPGIEGLPRRRTAARVSSRVPATRSATTRPVAGSRRSILALSPGTWAADPRSP